MTILQIGLLIGVTVVWIAATIYRTNAVLKRLTNTEKVRSR